MRGTAILAMSLVLAGSVHAQDKPPEESYWTPDSAMIARLEARLKIMPFPNQATYQLAQYNRYYVGITVNGRRQIRGVLIVPPNREDSPKTGVFVTDWQYLPRLLGGGCANVPVTYWVDTDFSFASCSLPDAYAPVSQQPHWKPDEQTAERMEAVMRDYMHGAFPGIASLTRYSRYYWGVTIDGKPMIRGRILMLTPREPEAEVAPSMHLASDWDNGPIMLDGGCNNISSVYDASAARLTQFACDGAPGPQRPLP